MHYWSILDTEYFCTEKNKIVSQKEFEADPEKVVRLVKMRNPWGKGQNEYEYKGPWGDNGDHPEMTE
jgi:hypothetical protein